MLKESKLRINDKFLRQRSRPPETSTLEVVDIFIRNKIVAARSCGCRVITSKQDALCNKSLRQRRSKFLYENESYFDRQSQPRLNKQRQEGCKLKILQNESMLLDPSISVLQLKNDGLFEDTQLKGDKDLFKRIGQIERDIRRQPFGSDPNKVSPIIHSVSLFSQKNISGNSLAECELRNNLKIPSKLSIILPKTCSINHRKTANISYSQIFHTSSRLNHNTSSITQLCNEVSMKPPTTRRLPIQKPYDKTIAVYSVYDEIPKRKKTISLESGTNFSIQFYRSMGDGERGDRGSYRDGYGVPCACIPNSYSSFDMANVGRDEDGCICLKRPPQRNYEGMNTCYNKGSFLKRYLRVLLKEQRRCMCGKKRPRPCPYRTCRRNFNVGCQSRCKNTGGNFRGNDAACQCKYKEKIEQRPDRDIFCKDRGITCCVPQCKSNSENDLNTFLLPETRDQPAVNIGSNFSFQMGFIRRCFDNRPASSEPRPDDGCCCSIPAYNDPNPQYMRSVGRGGDCCCSRNNIPLNKGPKSGSILNLLLSTREPKMQYKRTKIGRSGDNCCCSQNNSNDTLESCCCTNTNTQKSWWKPKKNKAVQPCKCDEKPVLVSCTNKKDACCGDSNRSSFSFKNKAIGAGCRCEEKPIIVQCTNKTKNAAMCCSSTCNANDSKEAKSSKIKNIGCYCEQKPVTVQCTNRQKDAATCCSKCNLPVKKDTNDTKKHCCCEKNKKEKTKDEKNPNKTEVKNETEGRSCCCENIKQKEPDKEKGTKFSKLNFSKVYELSKFFHKKKASRETPCDRCDHDVSKFQDTKNCKCGKKVGDFDYKQVLSNMMIVNERKRITKAQQCACKEDFDYKKAFGRLLLYNTVQEPICCSGGRLNRKTSDPFSKAVGFGEEDLRKPPCRRQGNWCPGIGSDDDTTQVKVKNFFNRLIKQNTCCTSMQYHAFNPLNQNEAGIQHTSREGPKERVGREVICKNQGSCVARDRPMTVKECENAALAAPPIQAIDPNRKAVRIGSSCNFCIEFYRGLPPAKGAAQPCPPPCPAPCPPPCPPPCPARQATNFAPVRDRICIPSSRRKRPQQSIVKKTFNQILLRDQQHVAKVTSTCQKCKKCARDPLLKRGFAALLLSGQPKIKPRMCQKTNTLQPNRRLVTRKPPQGAKGVKCDPYVCLKRINQSRKNECCK